VVHAAKDFELSCSDNIYDSRQSLRRTSDLLLKFTRRFPIGLSGETERMRFDFAGTAKSPVALPRRTEFRIRVSAEEQHPTKVFKRPIVPLCGNGRKPDECRTCTDAYGSQVNFWTAERKISARWLCDFPILQASCFIMRHKIHVI
jgi:hypothetical protein